MLVCGPAIGVITLLAVAALVISRMAPRSRKKLERELHRLRGWLTNVAIVPKTKLAIAFFQTVSYLPSVYGLELPDSYYSWLTFLSAFEIDWSGFAIPGACMKAGFRGRLFLRGTGPLILMAVVCMI
eukprot:5920565-Prymnesium_polylepis.1